jgi:hypothetical protein
MSETVAPVSPPSPGAAEPGPTPGTQAAPLADAVAAPPLLSETTVEAVETPAPEPAPAVETKPSSVISEAVGEPEPKAEEPKVEEVKAEEPKAEEPKVEEVKPPEPLAPPVYDALTLPEGVTVEDEKVNTFSNIIGEYENKVATDPSQAHAVFSELRQKLADFHIGEMTALNERAARMQREVWDRTIDDWQKSFREDPEIGKNRQDTTIQRIGGLLNLYGQQTNTDQETAVRDAFGLTGAGNHPEVIRFFNWAASRLTERPRVVTPMLARAPVKGTQSRAERLYKTSQGAG